MADVNLTASGTATVADHPSSFAAVSTPYALSVTIDLATAVTTRFGNCSG